MTCRVATLSRIAALSVTLVLCASSIAAAQTSAADSPVTLNGLATLLDRTVVAASPLAPPARISKFQGVPKKRVRNGAIAGASIGFGVGFLAQWGACENDCLMGDDPWTGLAVFTGVGAAIGMAIGAGMNHKNRTAGAQRGKTVAVAPLISRTRQGLAFSMTWR